MKKFIFILSLILSLISCSNDSNDEVTNNCNCKEVRLKYQATTSGVIANWVPYGVADVPRPDLGCEMNGVKFFESNQSTQNYVLIYKGVYVCE